MANSPDATRLSPATTIMAVISFLVLPLISLAALGSEVFVLTFWDNPNAKMPAAWMDRTADDFVLLLLAGAAWLVFLILFFADKSRRRGYYCWIPGVFFLVHLLVAAWAWSALSK